MGIERLRFAHHFTTQGHAQKADQPTAEATTEAGLPGSADLIGGGHDLDKETSSDESLGEVLLL